MERSRRLLRPGLLAGLAVLLVLGALQLRPAARADGDVAAAAGAPGEPDPRTPEGDPSDPAYWRYCSIDGFLSSRCGGTQTACPPGTEMASLTWLGTCRNPADGRDYVISYNDCCGKTFCGQGFVNRNEGDMPVYFTPNANDINWCLGSSNRVYNSTVAIVVGVAGE